MLGDPNKYTNGDQLAKQQDAQKQRMMDERAGQQRLPIDMPSVDVIVAQRKAMNMTEDETNLACSLLVFHVMALIMLPNSREVGREAATAAKMQFTAEQEAALITLHRQIVAKAVSASRLPASGNL